MRRVALKGLWLRRGRAALTALAVILGVAMVSGTYVLTDTISKAFDEIFTGGYANTSAVVTPQEGRGLRRQRRADRARGTAGEVRAAPASRRPPAR